MIKFIKKDNGNYIGKVIKTMPAGKWIEVAYFPHRGRNYLEYNFGDYKILMGVK